MTPARPPGPAQLSADELRDMVQGPGDSEWKYEMRRECQEIIPGLLLGPFLISKSLETLQSLGITHVLCIRDAKEAFSVKPRFPEHFIYMTLDVQDTEDQNLIRLFPGAKKFIDDAIARGGRVLVHCNGGISLSPSFVIMFVMEHFQLSWEDALHMVQNRRYCIAPNSGFMTQIKEYESIYKANATLASYPQQMERTVSRRKRSEDDEEGEMRDEDRKRILVHNEDTTETDPNAMES
ncbi:phosphotyrosine protein [Punctularia strigosozonata HHB-11173 SS5]|uniref:phosphotyrosine protein n=1 Tax=Punctularia strigosozonata (strain HHB-11173) TaxID=741275 RepID=UPI0004417C45|nr:phosphotyrosine protein [Punctularia strigosozonata HHB-11173 SS5]EIN12688.1 phosphotyrosine protein [Punctularia strigosozonata HHB-11173 SS5]